MAFWNAPLDVPAHARRACESALAMFDALEHLNARRAEEATEEGQDYLPLNIGIGINSGNCLVGNMGSDQRFDYSVLGDAVNLASRLEGQSTNYGVGIVIGEETARQAADGFAILELDLIAVKGKSEAVRIFTLLGDSMIAHSAEFADLRDRHMQMIQSYRLQDWDGTERLIDECINLATDMIGQFDLAGLYGLYRDRIATFRASPPPSDWDGVFVATSK
jgi:adenylate cyclase